jgi:hypothetical protein
MSGVTEQRGALWSRIADLPLEIEDYSLERLQRDVSSDFTRVSTVLRLRGDGHEGLGEDVSYDADDQLALQDAGPVQPLAGSGQRSSVARWSQKASSVQEPASGWTGPASCSASWSSAS